MSAEKITISLGKQALARLDRVAPTRSGYIAHMIEFHGRDVAFALRDVMDAGWLAADLLAVARGLLGSYPDTNWKHADVAFALRCAGVEERIIDAARPHTRSLIVIAQEYDAGNAAVLRRLES